MEASPATAPQDRERQHHWYRNSIIYAVDVQNYRDGNGDGVGDFAGLTACLGYLNCLGVDCLWLLPVFDSPSRDNGYDVRDYYALHPRLGTFGDFARFMEAAEQHGIRVLVDLPVNHSSCEHPWFQSARRDRASPYHDWYVWSDALPADHEPKLILGEKQGGNWTYEPAVERWYYHSFYAHQPDLNFSNPDVREEIERIMRFWLRQGVAGFRLDAAAHMLEERGSVHYEGPPAERFSELRAFVEGRDASAVLLAEVDEEPAHYRDLFAGGRGLHMILNFYLCNHLFLAFADGDGEALRQAYARLPDYWGLGQWANFLRNHDELDLERLSENERERVMRAFAPDADMRLFGRGIRRRLAPMLGDDPRRLALAFSLLLTLPGTPVLLYGDEIGLGEDLAREEREAVRLLMQWSAEANGGFSAAPPDCLLRPALREGPWGYLARNVTDQRRDPASTFSWLQRALHLRRDCPELGAGRLELLACTERRVFAHRCRLNGRYLLCVHNLSAQALELDLDLDEEDRRHLLDLFGDRVYPPWMPGEPLRLGPYGFRWLRRTALGREP